MTLKNSDNNYIIKEINKQISSPEELIRNAEEFYHSSVKDAVASIKNKQIICISGPSASGKTTTSHKLRENIIASGRDCIVVSLDDFYKDRDKLPIIDGQPNPEVVEALEIDLIQEKLNELLKNGKTLLPVFDFKTGTRIDNARKVEIEKKGVCIVEGIHGLNPIISSNLPADTIFKVYLSPHSGFSEEDTEILTKRQVRFIRRMIRDFWARGSSAQNTFYMWKNVCDGEDIFIRPLVNFADFRIDTVHSYEPCLFAKQAISLLNTVSDEKYNDEALYLINVMSKFINLSPDLIPKDSLMWEFLEYQQNN